MVSSEREREYRERGFWRDDDTLARWLARHATERPQAPALVAGGERVAWAALAERVHRAAGALARRGIVAGDVVAVQLPNVAEFVVAYLAVTRLGGVFCTLHMPYRGAEVEALMRHSGARLAIVLPEAKPMFGGKGIAFGELDAGTDAFDGRQPAASEPFLLLYTSGTTAAPKGVLHPYRTMLGNARLGAAEHCLSESDRVLCAAPFSHLYGLYSLHCAWAVGACTVLLPAFKPEALAAAVEQHRPSALWTAPAHVAACLAAGLFERHDWSSLRLLIVSGSMAPPPLVRELAAKLPRCAVTQLWGMTELQAGLYTRPSDPPERSATSAGRPSPGTEVRLGPDGELQVRGPLLFSGYLANPEETARAFTDDGWFRSGDLAEQDGEYFTITGRSKDLINRGGVKFNPAEVEMLLDAHPKILQSALVPMPDPVLGERACAFVVLRNPGDALTLEELAAYLLGRNIAKNKLPERLVLVPEMPLTPTRKVIKGRLKLP